MLSSICFMPASLAPQSLPPGVPDHRLVLVGDSIVVMCMRAGLYQTKNGLLVFFGSLRSRKSMTLAEISSSTVFRALPASAGPSSLTGLVLLGAVGRRAGDHWPRRHHAQRGLRIHRARDVWKAARPASSCTAARWPARSGSC